MEMGIKDRVAVVVGGSSGLGKAVARALCRERARVVIAARNEARLRQAAEEIRRDTGGQIQAIPADVTQPTTIDRLVEETLERWGRIDIALANAAGPPGTQFENTAPEQYERALKLNLLGTIRLAHLATRPMKKQRWGRFIALTSVAVKQPLPGLILSNTARAGVVGFVKTMATELAPYGVLCNVVAPGYMRTGRVEDLASERAHNEGREMAEVVREMEEQIPMQRMGRPEELADLVVFLASERASYITGTTIQVDGGFVKGLM